MRKFSTGAQGKKNLPAFATYTFIAVILLLTSGSASAQGRGSNSGSSHESERAAQVRALNNSVLHLHGQMQENASGGPGIRGQGGAVLAQRAAALQALIQEDPHAALSFAFSPELLADLAAKFPDSATQLESHATLSGPIERWVFDSADMKTSRSQYQMKIGRQAFTLHFAAQEPNLAKGGVFQVTGVVAGRDMAVSETSLVTLNGASGIASFAFPAAVLRAVTSLRGVRWLAFGLTTLLMLGVLGLTVGKIKFFRHVRQCAAYAAIAIFALNPNAAFAQSSVCSTTGAQQVAVLVVTFPGIAVPTFSPSLSEMFFGPAGSLTDYWQEASYGATSATGNVFGPFTLTGTYSCSNIRQFMDDSIAAAAASGVDFNTYHRVNIIFPDMNPSCGWAGISGIGCVNESTSAGTFNVSISALPWARLTPAVIFHENGHELGLAHARLRTFGGDVLGPIGTTGTLTEYGDHYSAMGVANEGHYAAGQKAEVLGWLSGGANFLTVASSGTYTLQPYESSPAGLNSLKIQRGTGNPGFYLWVEYRQPIGNYDPTMPYAAQPNGNVFTGALIHYEDSVTGLQTDLLDFTNPDTYADYPALAVGQTWNDAYSDLSLSVVSATSTGLTLNVKYSGSAACTSSAPSVVASPLNPSIYPGQTASYSVSVKNNDSTGCAPSTINLSSSEPSGWSTAFSTTSMNLSPGQSVSATLSKVAPSGTPAGTYAVDMVAATSTTSTTDMANATVVTPPSVSVTLSVSGTSFARPGTVPITAIVTNGGSPAAGANVTFTLTAPNGSISKQTATANSSGTASWNFKLNQRSPIGSYSAVAEAALSSGSKKTASTQTVLSNTTTFSVQ